MSNCPGSIILDYTAYSDEILDAIEASEDVHVYIFDDADICVEVYTFTYGELEAVGFEFEVPIKYSNCKAVVWHGIDSSDYDAKSMAKGVSSDEFMLELEYNTATSHFDQMPDPLWASPIEPIEFCAAITRHRIYMTRLHTEVYLSLRQQYSDGGVVDLDMSDYAVTIEAQNNIYETDYTISSVSSEIEYTNFDEVAAISYLSRAHVGTLRVMSDGECTLSVVLADDTDQIVSIGGAEELDLTKYMLMTKDDSSISDQRFLDLNKVWYIDMLIDASETSGYAAISLTINGWSVWFYNTEL